MRSSNSIKNFTVGILGQLITLILGFVSRTFFLMILNVNYLGVSGLFSSILTMLSLAELGVGTAIIYSLYKPLAENNQEEVLALMNLFKKIYRIIGVVVFIAGMVITPFLDYIIKDRKGIDNLELIYVLFVVQTAISYFFSYNRSLITADQKAYKLAKIDYLYKVVYVILPIGCLFITKDYICYLVTQIILTVLWNYAVFIKVRNTYPILKSTKKPKLSNEVKKAILKNTSAMMIYKVAIVITAGTSNVLITYFFDVAAVGFCANYTLIIQNMSALVSQGMSAITASIGNLNATENEEKKYQIFNIVFFLNFWLYGFASIGLYFCASPLVGAFFGEKYIISNSILVPMVLGFFVLGMQGATSLFRDAQGLFWYGKLRPIAQTIVNLGSSIILVLITNSVSAVYWGVVISRLATNFWYDPYVVHKYGLKRPLKPYFCKYAVFLLIAAVPFLICMWIFSLISISNIWGLLIIRVIICSLVVNGFFVLVFRKSQEYVYIKNVLQGMVKKIQLK